MISQVPITILMNTSAVTNIVGSRIYPVKIPQDATNPAIRVAVLNDVPTYAKDRLSEWSDFSVQVDCYANKNKPSDAVNLYDAIKTALEGKTGMYAGKKLVSMIYENMQELYEEVSDSYRIIIDFRMTIAKL